MTTDGSKIERERESFAFNEIFRHKKKQNVFFYHFDVNERNTEKIFYRF